MKWKYKFMCFIEKIYVFHWKDVSIVLLIYEIVPQNAMADSDDSIDDGQQILSYEHQARIQMNGPKLTMESIIYLSYVW